MESTHLEGFSRLSKEEIDKTYEIIKRFTKKVTSRESLEQNIRNIVKAVMLLKHHIGMPVKDIDKELSKIPARELRDIHKSMREAMRTARTRKDKLQRIARIMKVVDYFLQY